MQFVCILLVVIGLAALFSIPVAFVKAGVVSNGQPAGGGARHYAGGGVLLGNVCGDCVLGVRDKDGD